MYDNRTVRPPDVVACVSRRPKLRTRILGIAHAVCCAISVAMVSPASAEWTIGDTITLEGIADDVDDVEAFLFNIEFNTEESVYKIDELTYFNNLYLNQIIDILNQIYENDTSTTGTPTPIDPTWSDPGWYAPFPSMDLNWNVANLTPLYTEESSIVIEPKYFVEPDFTESITWTPPTKTGKTDFSTEINLTPLTSVFGGGTRGPIVLETDLSWYGGTIRTAVHAGLIALVSLGCGWLVIEEFRRTA